MNEHRTNKNGGNWDNYSYYPIAGTLNFGSTAVSHSTLVGMTSGSDHYGFHVVKGEHSLTLTPSE